MEAPGRLADLHHGPGTKQGRVMAEDAKALNEARLREGIARYVQANQSDPFTYARCMTHLRMGLLGPTLKGGPGHYDAERDGVNGWRNVARM